MSQEWDPKDPVVELRNVNVIHKSRTGGLFHPDTVHAVNDVSLTLSRGHRPRNGGFAAHHQW